MAILSKYCLLCIDWQFTWELPGRKLREYSDVISSTLGSDPKRDMVREVLRAPGIIRTFLLSGFDRTVIHVCIPVARLIVIAAPRCCAVTLSHILLATTLARKVTQSVLSVHFHFIHELSDL